ncbi:uncharacterized protein J8A68_005685 [[Candida] subhashii]|uniref:TIGR01456 family HAD hydrolase n=1 Tax=[Candida] subhashii TaxID=561895 RepID=A0A8J5UDZ8_9ASCO|nr:uncharacterized protein J8A68_005685 [[Candida] subhashii]KAG7660723.1 hypothetical protein J8A68_005685 [[Candida] subhashii]
MITVRAPIRLTRTLPRVLYSSFHTTIPKRTSNDIAFVFDIDGVLIKGKKIIKEAKPALELLNEYKIPYILMTNGGGVSEKQKADTITEIVGVPISPCQVVQSHTPMKALAVNNTYKRVMVIGGIGDAGRRVAAEYGFDDVVLPIDIVNSIPSISPHTMFKQDDLDKYAREFDISKPIDAVLVFHDPRDLNTDVQVVHDILNSEGGLIGTKRKITGSPNPAIPIIFSNNDYVYANDFNLPRFGQGAYKIIIDQLYKHTNKLKGDQNMNSLIMGKPFKVQYDFAHHVLIDWKRKIDTRDFNSKQVLPDLGAVPKDTPFRKIYMVGDNPASDIQGANDHGWESVLLRTGVYQDEDWENIIAKPTVGIFDHVHDAVNEILKSNRIV